jgi:hypothetical protein
LLDGEPSMPLIPSCDSMRFSSRVVEDEKRRHFRAGPQAWGARMPGSCCIDAAVASLYRCL